MGLALKGLTSQARFCLNYMIGPLTGLQNQIILFERSTQFNKYIYQTN